MLINSRLYGSMIMKKPIQKFATFAASLLLFAALAGVSSAHAQTRGWAHGGKKSAPSTSDLVPKMSSNMAYTERYGFAVDLDGGGHIGVDWTISNLGWGNGKGGADVRVNLPKHKNYRFKKELGEGEWQYSTKQFAMNIADTSVHARGKNSFLVTHKGEDISFSLTFTNTTPMWQPGNGEIRVKDGYYKFNILAPRANVKGHVTIGGKKINVKGTQSGYADHVATDIAPFDFAHRFSRLRTTKDDVSVMWREIKLHPNYGGQTFTWVMVGYKDKIVFSDADAQIRFAKMRKDPKSGYEFPMAIQIDAKSGKDSIKLVMDGSKFKRTDLLASYGTAAKVVASAVSNPYRYDVSCDYTLEMVIGGAKAQVSGKSHYVMDYINK
ncbi:Svf1-like protein [Bradymonas sediminis]|uniref:Uncharacterized protein n=2 Tax=Bradymonas sediminis TaxID=1548548 RepID=A0A2Z4FRE5_9DELT|nr:hypothetical protein DN745_18610 [Bradymonas sediminis]TDP73795.1 Svf1-like protein [Bradymonas sediminis]